MSFEMTTLIEEIKDAVRNDRHISSSLKTYSPTLIESKMIVKELSDVAYDVIRRGLYLDNKGNNCWAFYGKALELTDAKIEFPSKSSVVFEGRKKRPDWKTYALSRLSEVEKLIKDCEFNVHVLKLLPYTSTDYSNIKMLHAKDIIIFFKLIAQKYSDVVITKYTCFRFDDIDISMNCLEFIKKTDAVAYEYLIGILTNVLRDHRIDNVASN